MRAKLVRERDLADGGLVTEERQERLLSEIKDNRPAYVREVRRILEFLARVLGPVRVRDVTPDRMLERRRARLAGMEKRKAASPRTVNLELGVLKACLSWAERMNLIGRNPIARLKPVATNESTERKRRRSLTEDEIARFLRAADADDALRASLFAAEQTIAHGRKGAPYAARFRPRRRSGKR